MSNKIALGTAQFGSDYGISNKSGIVSKEEVLRILLFANSAGIDTLDTAVAYGKSEQVLGEIGVGGWNIVTKLPAVPEEQQDVESWVITTIKSSIKKLKLNKVDAVLLHDPSQIFSPKGKYILSGLNYLKKEKLVDYIGASIYNPDQIKDLLDAMPIEVVQAPLNIFDQRLLSTGWISRFNKDGIKIHIRSAFLQGLLLMNINNRPKKFDRWLDRWTLWDQWLLTQGLKPTEACLKFLLSISEIDKIIVGVDNASQLKEIMDSLSGDRPKIPSSLECFDKDLINPSNWNNL